MPWAPDYETAVDLAAYVRAAADDPYVAELGTAAARAVDTYCGRQFGSTDAPATFTYEAHRAARMIDGRWLLLTEDIHDATGLVVTANGTAVTAGTSGYRMWPRNAAALGQPYTGITLYERPDGDVELTTSSWGWAAVPAAVPSAVRFQVNRWFVRRDSPYGVAGSPSEGTEIRLGAVLDPDTRAILAGARLVRKRMPR